MVVLSLGCVVLPGKLEKVPMRRLSSRLETPWDQEVRENHTGLYAGSSLGQAKGSSLGGSDRAGKEGVGRH